MNAKLLTLAQRPDLTAAVDALHERTWARFVLEGRSEDSSLEQWYPLLDTFPEYQILLLDERQELAACGHTIPLFWDRTDANLPEGWAAMLLAGFADHQHGPTPNTLGALSIAVAPERRGQGLAVTLLRAMKTLAAEHALTSLLAPVRPSFKERYPLTPFDRYVRWTNPDGWPFDPWIRAHARLGARAVGVAGRSMMVLGSVDEWERWTGLAFPESGPYAVPGALVPIQIDRETNTGRYEEPGFWMIHQVP